MITNTGAGIPTGWWITRSRTSGGEKGERFRTASCGKSWRFIETSRISGKTISSWEEVQRSMSTDRTIVGCEHTVGM